MPRRTLVAATTLLVAATGIALASPVTAAPAKQPLYQATAAGTAVSVAGGTITSGPTASTAIRTRSSSQRSATTAAAVNVSGLLTLGTASTDSSTTRNAADTATTVLGHARTTGITVLGGVVSVDAVNTYSTLVARGNSVTSSVITRFVNLHVGDTATVNGEVDPNTTIEVPGVARVVLNASGTIDGTTDGMAVDTAIVVTVLGGTFAGSSVVINPTTAQVARVGLGYAPLSGLAIGAQVTAAGGDSSLSAGPFGAIGMPDVGTGNTTLTTTVASADLGALGTLGTLTSTANGVATDAQSRSTMRARVVNVDLLGGLVTADSLTAQADIRVRAGADPVPTTSVTFTGLKVLGVPVPADATPGLIIGLPGVGSVAIRATATTPTVAAAAALTITLDVDAFGLPAGSTVQVGFAYASLLTV